MNSTADSLLFSNARPADVSTYITLSKSGQAWLKARGLGQYVPSAHEEYAATVAARIDAGTLYAVWSYGEAIAFFNLDPSPSKWWRDDHGEAIWLAGAMYLAGMVVSESARGHGVGGEIIKWCIAETRRRGRQFVRLDCHADNAWLCGYYESHGFVLNGRVEQHPGYFGNLYEREVK